MPLTCKHRALARNNHLTCLVLRSSLGLGPALQSHVPFYFSKEELEHNYMSIMAHFSTFLCRFRSQTLPN